MTKERPILFSAPMVRAILAGRKTQTRRIVKDLDRYKGGIYNCSFCCPYGQPGERLWVRESVWLYGEKDVLQCARYPADAPDGAKPLPINNGPITPIPAPKRTTPSIHMPRWASRILLEITSVRVEQLQDISNHDIRAEGTPLIKLPSKLGNPAAYRYDHRADFMTLWSEVNGIASWFANPWVWVIEFKRIKP